MFQFLFLYSENKMKNFSIIAGETKTFLIAKFEEFEKSMN